MSDLDIELQESLREFAQFLFGELELLRANIIVRTNEWFEPLEPQYRLDENVRILTQHKLPTRLYFYSKN